MSYAVTFCSGGVKACLVFALALAKNNWLYPRAVLAKKAKPVEFSTQRTSEMIGPDLYVDLVMLQAGPGSALTDGLTRSPLTSSVLNTSKTDSLAFRSSLPRSTSVTKYWRSGENRGLFIAKCAIP